MPTKRIRAYGGLNLIPRVNKLSDHGQFVNFSKPVCQLQNGHSNTFLTRVLWELNDIVYGDGLILGSPDHV